MPTGYTQKLVEKGQTFEEFVWTCARAFGALVEMRDEPLDAPIPKVLEESDYYVRSVSKWEAEAKRLAAMSPGERLAFGVATKAERVAFAEKYLAENVEQNDRLIAVREQVVKWEPPTPDHAELKEFMLQQIDTSMNNVEWCTEEVVKAKAMEPLDYCAAALTNTNRMLASYRESRDEDKARLAQRNNWLAKLRESVRQP